MAQHHSLGEPNHVWNPLPEDTSDNPCHPIPWRQDRPPGAGASFFYFAPTTSLVSVPLASVDVPFVFQEVTVDFQEVTLQGQLTYRVADPVKLSQLMDYSIDAQGRHVSDDPTRLNERLIQLAQVGAHEFTQRERLEQLLTRCAELGAEVLQGLRALEVAGMLGLEILSLTIASAKPTPEMSKAMQADTREQLLLLRGPGGLRARNTAIELERQLKENELNTERAVEEKRREVRQAQMEADVAIEQQRAELVDRQVANNRKLAEAHNEALQATLDAMKSVDWKTLTVAMGSGDARGLDCHGVPAVGRERQQDRPAGRQPRSAQEPPDRCAPRCGVTDGCFSPQHRDRYDPHTHAGFGCAMGNERRLHGSGLKRPFAHRAQRAETVDAVTLAEADFDLYETENTRYVRTIEQLRDGLEEGFPVTILQRQYLSNYDFRNAVVVIVVGPDGLVANTAKYVGDLPIVGVNPDPLRHDGVLLPFGVEQVPRAVKAVLEQRADPLGNDG